MVACVARGGVMGLNGTLPWHIPEDLRHFKAVTLGHAIVMGRKTYASIGRALPGRRSIVVSREPTFEAPGCETATSLERALALAWASDDEPRVIGGASIYREALPRTTRVYLTRLARDVAGDVFFPVEGLAAFREVERVAGETEGVAFLTLVREEAGR